MSDNRNPTCDCLVIGAGIAGLMTATFLKRHGRSVKVVTREGHAGGKVRTYWRDGIPYPHASIYFFSDYRILLKLARHWGIPLAYANENDVAVIRDGERRYLSIQELLREQRRPSTYSALFRYLIHRRRLLLAHDRPDRGGDIDRVRRELAMPFVQWIGDNGYHFMEVARARAFQNTGYGFLDSEPTLYGLRLMSFGFFHSIAAGRVRYFPTTASAFLERMARDIDISYGAEFRVMTRAADGLWHVETAGGTFAARHVVFCCSPLQVDFARHWGGLRDDIFNAENIWSQTYGSARFVVADWFDIPVRGFLLHAGKPGRLLAAVRHGTLANGHGVYSTFFYTGGATRYSKQTEGGLDQAEMIRALELDIAADGGRVLEMRDYAEFPTYHTRFTGAAIGRGASLALDRLNGHHNVWHVGSLNALELMRELTNLGRKVARRIADSPM